MNPGEIIGNLANERGVNLHQLSKKAGVPYNTLYAIVKRKSERISVDTLEQIAAALGVPVAWLIIGPPSGDEEGQPQVTMDDFTIAFQAETKELTETDKQILLTMARELRAARNKAAHSEDK